MFTPQVIFYTILVFFVLVSIHEWGHYYFANRAGILVREFAIGFGPKLFSFKKGETRFTLRLLPLGGYARMAGEDPEMVSINVGQTIAIREENGLITHLYLDKLDERRNVTQGEVQHIDIEKALSLRLDVDGEPQTYAVHPQAMMVTRDIETQIAPYNRQYGSKTVGQRALAIFAGPFMNFLLAFLLFLVYVGMAGVPNGTLQIGKINDLQSGDKKIEAPAKKAGLQSGDIVKSVNGETLGDDQNRLIELISNSADKPMKWVVQRGGQQVSLDLVPANIDNAGKVGIEILLPTRSAGVGETIKRAGTMMGDFTKEILIGFKKLVTLDVKMDDMGGPVRIVEVTGTFANQGLDALAYWTAVLSLYLGLFNLLPVPALDGSRLIFLAIEAVRGKPVDPNRESLVHFIGFAMLMLLMLAVTYNDILRLFKG